MPSPIIAPEVSLEPSTPAEASTTPEKPIEPPALNPDAPKQATGTNPSIETQPDKKDSSAKESKKTAKPKEDKATTDAKPKQAAAPESKDDKKPFTITAPQREGEVASSSAPSKSNGPRYPWRKGIYTTVFWVGQPANYAINSRCNTKSAWDGNWMKSYGGFDDPNRRKGYWPSRFRPKQNPFYVALPFNDMKLGRHKPISEKIIPWFDEEYVAPNISVCKSRWIAIRYRGRVCYAQWEDVGPFEHDHAKYVFGKARPHSNRNNAAGLDVSPAVRDYLRLSGMDLTDWRFVEDSEVPDGPWKEIVNIRPGMIAAIQSNKQASTSTGKATNADDKR